MNPKYVFPKTKTPTAVDLAASKAEGAADHAATLMAHAVDTAKTAGRATTIAAMAAIDARAAAAVSVNATRDVNRALDKAAVT